MSVGGIGQYNAANAYAQMFGSDTANADEATKKKAAAAAAAAAGKGANTSQLGSYPNSSTLQDLAGIAGAAMEAMGIGKNGRVSFGQITAYKEKLEKEYGEKMEADLAKLGVDPTIKFQLKLSADGKMEVISDHADKAKVQKYFDDNPEMVKKYKEIQGLADLEAARKSMQVNPTDMRKRIQVEAMATWWDQAGGSTNSIADFTGGDMSFYKGINKKV